jgi:hypothetical protein
MIRISITAAAFAAIERTLPAGSVAFEPKVNEMGEREIWLDPRVVNRPRVKLHRSRLHMVRAALSCRTKGGGVCDPAFVDNLKPPSTIASSSKEEAQS